MIVWQKDEFPVGQATCKQLYRDFMGLSSGLHLTPNGNMIVMNQRVMFVSKAGTLSKRYNIDYYSTNLEDITAIAMGKVGLVDTIVIMQMSQRMEYSDLNAFKPSVCSLFPIFNNAIIQRKNQIRIEQERERTKERIQIVLDFSALKDAMSKGGLVMTTYKCPNCSGKLEIPEAGQVLSCRYCGTPIKPIDIFERIKDLLQ
ncbi:MAG: hypothetical protein ACQCN6_03600 [Candidatus Bathyarchaeia archaeon]